MSAQAATSTSEETSIKNGYQSRPNPAPTNPIQPQTNQQIPPEQTGTQSLDTPDTALPRDEEHSIKRVQRFSEHIAVFDANNHLHHVLITSRSATAATMRRMIAGDIEPSQAQEIISVIEAVNQRAFRLFEQAKLLSNSTLTESSLASLDQQNESEFACFPLAQQKD